MQPYESCYQTQIVTLVLHDKLMENTQTVISNILVNSFTAQRFYENVMKRETELFNCFQKQFFPINCKKKTDVEPIKDVLEIIVAKTKQVIASVSNAYLLPHDYRV